MRVEQITDAEGLEAALAIRYEVFVDEQGVDPDSERDALDDDPRTVHVLVSSDTGEPLATGRLLAPGSDSFHGEGGFGAMDPGVPHIGRVAVRAVARGTGAGKAVMEFLEEVALELYGTAGEVRVELSAQDHAIPFYERLGYQTHGEGYLDENIPHLDAFKVVRALP